MNAQFVLALALPCLVTCSLDAQTVHRRGGNQPINGVNIDLLPDGVLVEREGGAKQLVPWDMVREIDDITNAADRTYWSRVSPMSEDLWRARTRLQRGDGRLAGPLFEKYFDQVRDEAADSELALIVSEGLLRSRLASGELEKALPCAMETIRLRRAGITTDRYLGLPTIVDETLWVVPTLPPMASDRSARNALAMSLSPWSASDDQHVASLSRAYAAIATSRPIPSPDDATGIALVKASLSALSPDPQARLDARAALAAAAAEEGAPAFIDAWRSWFVAHSMLLEEEVDLDLVLLELLRIPAIHAFSDPALASRAVSAAASALDRAGRVREADLLRRELRISQVQVRPALEQEMNTIPDESKETDSTGSTNKEVQ